LKRRLGGSDLAQYISDLDKEISELGSQIPIFDGAVVLLRLEDAFDNLMHTIGAEIHQKDDELNIYRAGTFRFATTGIALVEDGLTELLRLGKNAGHILDDWPSIEFFFGYPKADENPTEEAMRIGFVNPGDYWITLTVSQGIGGAKGKAILKLISPSPQTKQFTIDILWYWLGLVQKKNIASLVLRQGGSVELTDIGDLEVISVKDETKEKADFARTYEDLLAIRKAYISPHDWASDFKRKGVEAALTVGKGIHSQENIEALTAEIAEISRAYRSFPGYRSTFRSVTGYTFEEFVAFTEFLGRLARTRDHSVYYEREDALLQLAKDDSFEPRIATKIISSLTLRQGARPEAFPIFRINDFLLFSLRRILALQIQRPVEIFEHHLNNDIRGREFEKHCRRLLRERGFSVYPRRLIITDFLPANVSIELWGFEKKKSDVDLIATKNGFVLVAECKELKRKGKGRRKHRTSDLNVLIKAGRENYYKARRLSETRRNLVNPKATNLLSAPDLRVIVPLVVTNQQYRSGGAEDVAAVVALEDLLGLADEIIKNSMPFPSPNGILTIHSNQPEAGLVTPTVSLS